MNPRDARYRRILEHARQWGYAGANAAWEITKSGALATVAGSVGEMITDIADERVTSAYNMLMASMSVKDKWDNSEQFKHIGTHLGQIATQLYGSRLGRVVYNHFHAHNIAEKRPLPDGFVDFAHRSSVLTDQAYKQHGERLHFRNWEYMPDLSDDRVALHQQGSNWHATVRGTRDKIDWWQNLSILTGAKAHESKAVRHTLKNLADAHFLTHGHRSHEEGHGKFYLSGHSQGGSYVNDALHIIPGSENILANYVHMSMSHSAGPGHGHKHSGKHHKVHNEGDPVSITDNPRTGAHQHFVTHLPWEGPRRAHSLMTNRNDWVGYKHHYHTSPASNQISFTDPLPPDTTPAY